LASHLASALDINIEHAFDGKTKPPEDFPGDYDIMKPPANPNCIITGNGGLHV
jgi:L-ascorbate oxidase